MLNLLLTAALFAPAPQGGGSDALVVINEFLYDNSGTDNSEFIELYNRSESPVDMSLWVIESRDANGGNAAITLPENTILAPGAFYLIGASNVPNVDLAMPADTLPNDNETILLCDSLARILDTLVYESNKGLWDPNFVEGQGLWGNVTSPSPGELSWSRVRDGWDSNSNGLDFALRPWTPGAPNVVAPTSYSDNYDSSSVEADVADWPGTFTPAHVIDPTVVSASNPNVIAASPQGGNAAIFWDSSGGGNVNILAADGGSGNVVVEGWVYFDAAPEPAGLRETWSLGAGGTTGSRFNEPDPSGTFGFTANGNTGVSWTYQVTDSSAVLYLVDHNDGGWGATALTEPTVLGQIAITPGDNDGWQRLRLEIVGNQVLGTFGGSPGCADGTRIGGTLDYVPVAFGVYLGYREFTSPNSNARPFTVDDFSVTTWSGNVEAFGTATPTTVDTPAIDLVGPPTIGNRGFALALSGLVPNGSSLLVHGIAKLNPAFDLSVIGGPAGSVFLIDPLATFAISSDGEGEATFDAKLFCDVALLGVPVYWQVFDVDNNLPDAIKVGHSAGLETAAGR